MTQQCNGIATKNTFERGVMKSSKKLPDRGPPMLTKSALKDRGWTDSVIAELLPSPDMEKKMRGRPFPMKLYLVEKVEQIEATATFKSLARKIAIRKAAGIKSADTKRKKLAVFTESLMIKVPKISNAELIERACNHYNWNSRSESCASKTSPLPFQERICVNYLRHQLTGYERALDEIKGLPGAKHDAYLEIKSKVLDAIAEAYPWLASECNRQHGEAIHKILEFQ
jgi:hypothetical protein